MARPYSKKELDALRYIRNSIVHTGKSPSLRDIMMHLEYKSPYSAMLAVDKFIAAGVLRRKENNELQLLQELESTSTRATTINVPLVGSVPCGAPLLAEENLEAMIPVSTSLARPPHRYFLLRATGDSMDKKGILDGNLLLIRQQPDADNGQNVVALIDNEATVKELHKGTQAIVLKPQSTNPEHHPIVLDHDFQIQGVVTAILPKI